MNTRTAPAFRITPATEQDVGLILHLIRELAEYEKLTHEVVATEVGLREALFGERAAAEVVIAYAGEEPAGFAVFFQSFSTFVGRPGLYLEDLFVVPKWRGHGLGRMLLAHLARIAVGRNYGRMEWSVLDWNELALNVYRRIGARPMDEWTVYRLTGDALRALADRAVGVTSSGVSPT
jgi:GNAT superfamily N-acetyltransferase